MLVLAKELGGPAKNLIFDPVWLHPEDQEKIFPFEGIPAGRMLEEKITFIGGKIQKGGRIIIFLRLGHQNAAGMLLEK